MSFTLSSVLTIAAMLSFGLGVFVAVHGTVTRQSPWGGMLFLAVAGVMLLLKALMPALLDGQGTTTVTVTPTASHLRPVQLTVPRWQASCFSGATPPRLQRVLPGDRVQLITLRPVAPDPDADTLALLGQSCPATVAVP